MVLVASYLVTLALAWALQERLIYEPGPSPGPPDAVLPGASEHTVTASDGTPTPLWWVPPIDGGDEPAPAVLVLHGVGGSRGDSWPVAAALREAGIAVVLAEYRGYGEAAGTPSERGLVADARAALAWLRARNDVDPTRVVVLGESLGAAVAVRLAIEAEGDVAAVVLRSPFTSLHAVAQRSVPLIPYTALLRSDYRTIDQIDRLGLPLLVAAGVDDDLTPYAQSRTVFERATGPKRLLVLEGTGHFDRRWQLDADYLGAVAALAHDPTSIEGTSTETLPASGWECARAAGVTC